MPANTYQQRIAAFQTAIAKEKKFTSTLSWARLFSFIVALYAAVEYFRHERNPLWLPLVAIGLVAFGWLLKKYTRAQRQLELLKTLLELNEKELKLVTANIADFDDGNIYVDDRHDFTGDLDVFGSSSLYQYINRTGTLSGSKLLAERFRNPLQDVAAIEDTQAALQVLTPELDFRQYLSANALLAKEDGQDRREIGLWLQMPQHFFGKRSWEIARWLCPALAVAMIFVYAFTGAYYPLVLVLLVNWCILLSCQKKVLEQHSLMARKESILDKLDVLLQSIIQMNVGESKLLKEQQAIAAGADTALRQLARISGALDQRLNLLVGFVLNSILLYDVHCMVNLERWKSRHRDQMNSWFEVIAIMEVWNSFATFAFNHPGYNYPKPVGGKLLLEATVLGHPLIPEAECIRNNGAVGANASFLIITGSNMSGKSTFLRSVGANLLLAMCGAPVCAASFTFSPMRIMTSMRIKDSIASHTSYFQAELLRLQHIIQQLKAGVPIFILLDEILKGTNSEDKLSGSRSLIEHFLAYQCLGMIATHDLELGQLETAYPARVRNYCFESTIRDNHLFFDYRIREGIARNKNATFLMKQMEII